MTGKISTDQIMEALKNKYASELKMIVACKRMAFVFNRIPNSICRDLNESCFAAQSVLSSLVLCLLVCVLISY